MPNEPQPPIFQTLDRTERFPYPRGWYVRRALWSIVQSTFYRIPLPRSYGWRRFLLKLFGAKMGTAAAVHPTTRIMHPWLLEMGDWSNLSHGVTVYNLGPVTIGHHTVVSQDVYLCAGSHDYKQSTLPLLRPPITVGDGVWISAGAFIGPGVTIGNNSVVGARTVVMSNVEAGVVVAGNPARVISARGAE